MVDKNLFLYDLAVVAILKDEGHYIKEWLDYHLLAGVDHFYLYNNDSSDNYEEIIAPYVEAGLVTSTNISGKLSLRPAYYDAVKRFKFFCRYMAFIDLDEFIYPKTNRSIVEVAAEILSRDSKAAGLGIHWQEFGSNNHEKADYSRGVLERFTRRARKNFYKSFTDSRGNNHILGNVHLKTLSNPRLVKQATAHYANYFEDFHSVDEKSTALASNTGIIFPIFADKIAVNHYRCKSKEEFTDKLRRGSATNYPINNELFAHFDNNEVFDDGILKYRAARAQNFSIESDENRINRVTESLTEILSAYANGKIFDVETALTCRAVSSYLHLKVHEEASLAAILNSLKGITVAEAQLFIRDLPNLLTLPYPAVKEIHEISSQIIAKMIPFFRMNQSWQDYCELDYLRDVLRVKERFI